MRHAHAHVHGRRRGTTIAELIAALPLLALLGVVAVQLTIAAHRHALRVDAGLSASRELRQSANVLATELRAVRASDLRAISDTAIDFRSLVGTGVMCAVDGTRRRIALAAGAPTDAWAVVWQQSPQPGDEVWLWRSTIEQGGLIAVQTILSAVSGSVACAGSPLTRSTAGAAVSLELPSTLPWIPVVGSPVRVTRRTRYALYRATDGDWYLGRRTLGPAGWDVLQPVAGPLESAAHHGLVFTAYTASGVALTAVDSLTSAVRIGVMLRAPQRVGRAAAARTTIDSLEVQVALRGESGAAR